MTSHSFAQFSACKLAKLIRHREVSCEQVVTWHLQEIRRLNPILNSVIQIAPDSAIAQARSADTTVRRREPLGPLHGVPFTVKDVYAIRNVAELLPMPGMPPLLDLPRDHDSTAVLRLREAGAILIAVTRATVWHDRENRYGPVHNPYDLTKDASGSSGGEAATIAAGASPLGLGSDSGGSLRTPAARCGIVTIRPLNGRVPRATDAAGTADIRTVAGPLARRVEDIALALSLIAGVDPLDPSTEPMPLRDYTHVDISALRVGICTKDHSAPALPSSIAAVQTAAQALRNGGAITADIRLPAVARAWEITQEYWRGYPSGADAGERYGAFLNRWDAYRIELAQFMRDFDLLITPVDPLVYTCIFSLAGFPAAVVRAGVDCFLPVGVQLVAAPWRDDIALAAAAQVEAFAGGWQPPPPLYCSADPSEY